MINCRVYVKKLWMDETTLEIITPDGFWIMGSLFFCIQNSFSSMNMAYSLLYTLRMLRVGDFLTVYVI